MRAIINYTYCTSHFSGIASGPESRYIHISQRQEVRTDCHVCITDKSCCVDISKICRLKQKQAISSSYSAFLFILFLFPLFFSCHFSLLTVSHFASTLLLTTTDTKWRTRQKGKLFYLRPPPLTPTGLIGSKIRLVGSRRQSAQNFRRSLN